MQDDKSTNSYSILDRGGQLWEKSLSFQACEREFFFISLKCILDNSFTSLSVNLESVPPYTCM